MSAQQKKLNIYTLVNGFEDEFLLDACYQALESIVKAYQRGVTQVKDKSSVNKRSKTVQKADLKDIAITPVFEETKGVKEAEYTPEKVIPHDLSLVFLANEIFKDSKPLPEEAILAFDDALMESALTTPTLPNRL